MASKGEIEIYKNRWQVIVRIGGIAASILGTPRFTGDINAIILMNIKYLPPLMEKATENGLVSRISDPIQ